MNRSKTSLRKRNRLPQAKLAEIPSVHSDLAIQRLDGLIISIVDLIALLVLGYFRAFVLLLGPRGLSKFEWYLQKGRIAPSRLTLLVSSLLFAIAFTAFDLNKAVGEIFRIEEARETAERIIAGDSISIGLQVVPLFFSTWLFSNLLGKGAAIFGVKRDVAIQITTHFIVNIQIALFVSLAFNAYLYRNPAFALLGVTHARVFHLALFPIPLLAIPLLTVLYKKFRPPTIFAGRIGCAVLAAACGFVASGLSFYGYMHVVLAATSQRIKSLDSLVPRREFEYSTGIKVMHVDCDEPLSWCEVVVRNASKVDALMYMQSIIQVTLRERRSNSWLHVQNRVQIKTREQRGDTCCVIIPPGASLVIKIEDPLNVLCVYAKQYKVNPEWYKTIMAIKVAFNLSPSSETTDMRTIPPDQGEDYVNRRCPLM